MTCINVIQSVYPLSVWICSLLLYQKRGKEKEDLIMRCMKIATTTLLAALAGFFLTIVTFADGECGPNLKWTISDDGTLTISGNGEMTDFSYSNVPWKEERDQISRIVIEDGVTTVGEHAFYYCRNLLSAQLPDSLVSIGKYAFENCDSLVSVNIPNGISSIREQVFYGCDNLSGIVLPENLASIDRLAFYDCRNLGEIVIPASVTIISDYRVFDGCSRLANIIVEDNNPNYISEDGVLFNKDRSVILCYPCGKTDTSYQIPEGVTAINQYAFYQNENIQKITVPGSVIQIGENAFGICEKLSEIVLNEGIQSIGATAFHHCRSLPAITFPSSLVYLGDDVFESCSKLMSIQIAGDSGTYKSVDDVLFSADGTVLIAYPNGKGATSYTVPDSVTTIGDYAFIHNRNIVTISFPEGLISIGKSAFNGCDKITSLDFPSTLTSIESNAFSSCDGLTSLVIPESVTVLGYEAFSWCDNLTNVTIKNAATSFDKYGVFDYCGDALALTGIAGSTTENHANEEGFLFIEANFGEAEPTVLNDTWICSECGSEMDGGNFCSECGAARPKGQICQNCGYEVEEGKTFNYCPECGTKFE